VQARAACRQWWCERTCARRSCAARRLPAMFQCSAMRADVSATMIEVLPEAVPRELYYALRHLPPPFRCFRAARVQSA